MMKRKEEEYDVVYPHYLGIMRNLSWLFIIQMVLVGFIIGFIIRGFV